MDQTPNRLLASLNADAFAALKPHLKTISMSLGEVLAKAGEPVRGVHFPHSGIISLIVELKSGMMIETAMIGRDGAFNSGAALDGRHSLNKGLVQLEGVASVIQADKLRIAADQHSSLRTVLIAHDQVLFAEAQQTAACNATHDVHARSCRWLLRMRELSEGNELFLTHEFLAHMLGVRRTTVTLIAKKLSDDGLISYARGRVRILDVEGLRREACECYDAVKAHYSRMLGHVTKPRSSL